MPAYKLVGTITSFLALIGGFVIKKWVMIALIIIAQSLVFLNTYFLIT